jgi:hypothetical protein
MAKDVKNNVRSSVTLPPEREFGRKSVIVKPNADGKVIIGRKLDDGSWERLFKCFPNDVDDGMKGHVRVTARNTQSQFDVDEDLGDDAGGIKLK